MMIPKACEFDENSSIVSQECKQTVYGPNLLF